MKTRYWLNSNGDPITRNDKEHRLDRFQKLNGLSPITKPAYTKAVKAQVKKLSTEEVNEALWDILETLVTEHPKIFKQKSLDVLEQMRGKINTEEVPNGSKKKNS